MAKDNNTPDTEAKKAQKEAEKAAEKAKQARIKASKPKKEGTVFSRAGAKIAKYWRDFRGVCKKITWPNGKTVMKNTLVVLLSILIIGAGVWIVDFLLSQGIKQSDKIIKGIKERAEETTEDAGDTDDLYVTTTAVGTLDSADDVSAGAEG